ncbi:MAG TPA: hypothetical protein VLH75_20445 [Longimicrobiales bacterium]|nr:hypothetical protein [Longimicrobiales bacterium]
MSTQEKKGFAMPAAVGALVIVGVLVTAGFYMANQELRIGVANRNAATAVNLAQSSNNRILVNRSQTLSSMPIWGVTTIADTAAQGISSVQVTRLSTYLYFLDATSTVTEGGALWSGGSRRVGLVARLVTANINPPAALTTQGTLTYGGSAQIHGNDAPPNGTEGGQANWTSTCPTTGLTNKPGILIDDTLSIDWNGNRNKIEANMNGNPRFAQDTSITAANLMAFGDMGWAGMVALAEKVYSGAPVSLAPVVTGGVCDTSVKDNWGAPTNTASPCFNYFPIIYFSGDVQLSSGVGQGIMLVQGDLKVTGGFEFYGPVYVQGTLTTMGSGGHFWGGVTAANAELDDNTVLGNAVITYSSCAVTRALLNNSALTKIRPIAMRSWVDLSGIVGG